MLQVVLGKYVGGQHCDRSTIGWKCEELLTVLFSLQHDLNVRPICTVSELTIITPKILYRSEMGILRLHDGRFDIIIQAWFKVWSKQWSYWEHWHTLSQPVTCLHCRIISSFTLIISSFTFILLSFALMLLSFTLILLSFTLILALCAFIAFSTICSLSLKLEMVVFASYKQEIKQTGIG